MELILEDVTKQYAGTTAVKQVSLDLHPGVTGLLGANGAGKTTLMRMICGILRPTAGTVCFRTENDILNASEELYRDALGYLPQDFGFDMLIADEAHYVKNPGARRTQALLILQRKALRTTLVRQLFEHERIQTTQAKALAFRGDAEKLITLAKKGNEGDKVQKMNAARLASSRLGNDREITQKLFDDIAPRFKNRNGGYTRMIKLGPRKGDSAEMVLIELVSE